MTRDEAYQILQRLQLALQKARSNLRDRAGMDTDHDPIAKKVVEELLPWVADDRKTLLIPISKLVEAGPEKLTGSDFYNCLTVAHRLQSQIAYFYFVNWGEELPTPDFRWVVGFDEPEREDQT